MRVIRPFWFNWCFATPRSRNKSNNNENHTPKKPKQQHRHETNNKISLHLILPSCFTQIHVNPSVFSNHEKFKTLRNQPFEIMSFISYFKQKKSIASGRIQLETLNLFFHLISTILIYLNCLSICILLGTHSVESLLIQAHLEPWFYLMAILIFS